MRVSNTTRLKAEVGLACACAALAALTMVWPDWIEEIFGVDPDRHSGLLEWMIVVGLAVVSVVSGILARVEWRRQRGT